jgi:hypothetical protein
MTKIDKVLKKLSDLYEFNRKIKSYSVKKKEKAGQSVQPTRKLAPLSSSEHNR